MNLRESLELPNLRKETNARKIEDEGKKAKPQLRKLEAYAALLKQDVYDLETFKNISGSWFLRRFNEIKPYIDLAQRSQSSAYEQLVELNRLLRKKTEQRVKQRADDEDDEESS